jgi:hypothetical protein
MAAVIGLLLLAPWSLAVAGVRAQPKQPGLNWIRLPGAERCLGASELASRVDARLGRAVFVAVGDAAFFVDGHVARTASGYDVTIDITDATGALLGRRSLSFVGDDCAAIEDAVSLVIAVTVDPRSALPKDGVALEPGTSQRLDQLFGAEQLDPEPDSLPAATPVHTDEKRPAAAAPAADLREPEAPHSSRDLTAALSGGVGQLPGVVFGVSASARVRVGVPLELGLTVMPHASARGLDSRGNASFALGLASLAVCPLQEPLWATLTVCTGAELGLLRATSSGFANGNRTLTDAIANLRASAMAQRRLAGPLEVGVALVVTLPMLQRSYSFRALDGQIASLFRMPQLGVRLELSLGLAF